ncbi:unnamed protein product [Urochloa decumbens]|uniref:F-box protein n=1 Tax=Urochloa decumbens TaxID=240449 RepID=A0ABC9F473_9POAL
MERLRLSELPDSLLHCILSRLGSRQGVQTTGDDAAWLYDRENVYDRFEGFADNLLFHFHRATPPVDTFRLCIDGRIGWPRHTNHARWVRRPWAPVLPTAALELRNRDGYCGIDLTAAGPEQVTLSIAMETPSVSRIKRSGAVDDTALVSIDLDEGERIARGEDDEQDNCFRFMDLGDRVTSALAAGHELPVLEDLRLEKCDYSFARIASTSLRNLDIHNCNACAYNVDALVLAAPRLATLRVRGDDPPPVVVASDDDDGGGGDEMMPSLVAAASLEHPAGVRGVLRSLHHVMELSLYRFGATALLDSGGGEEPTGGLLFPAFRNLRNLVLDECDLGAGCRALRRFLRNAPGLETLALRYCSFSGGSGRSRKRKARSDDDDNDDGRRVPAPSYECKNLKSIELEFHQDNDVAELDAVLEEIAKKVVHPIESCVQNGRCTVRIRYG